MSLSAALSASQAAPPSGGCITVATTTTCTFNYTGAAEAWTVPAEVTSATFDVFGAQGGDGGKGGEVKATLPVTPGETLQIVVGGMGAASGCNHAGGFNGGGCGPTAGLCEFGGGGGGQGALSLTGGTSAGGGGSNFTSLAATNVTVTNGVQSGNGLITVTYATPPTAVTLASASAARTAKGVLVRWRTGTEADLLGFQVYRSPGQSWMRLSRSLIVATGSVAGASYRFLDRTARRGVAYRYRIKALNRDGTTSWFGPVRVT